MYSYFHDVKYKISLFTEGEKLRFYNLKNVSIKSCIFLLIEINNVLKHLKTVEIFELDHVIFVYLSVFFKVRNYKKFVKMPSLKKYIS